MDKSFNDLTKELLGVWKGYEKQGTKPWTYDIAAQDLQYQVGSLAKRILQLKGYRYSDLLSHKEITESLSDELADIFAEVLFIAHELDIDLGAAWERMLASDKKKIAERSL